MVNDLFKVWLNGGTSRRRYVLSPTKKAGKAEVYPQGDRAPQLNSTAEKAA
jgi:hypothetical protein